VAQLWIRLLTAVAGPESLLTAAATVLDEKGLEAEADECRWQAFKLRVKRRTQLFRASR
jgi:hypothetical protein